MLSGTLDDPYTDTTIPFHQGTPAVQIDHVVASEDAWPTGAQQLDLQTRQNFANDPRDLQATDGPTNQKKGGRDAATGLPSNKDLPHHGSAARGKDQGNAAALNQTTPNPPGAGAATAKTPAP